MLYEEPPVSQSVIVNDVGPRDGLQNQPKTLVPPERVQLVKALLHAGMTHVEIGAFVSPKAVPAMAGAEEVLAGLSHEAGVSANVLTVLIPNLKGYERATAAGAKSVCMVLYGSEGMSQANVRMSRQQAESATASILARGKEDGVRVTSTIAVAFECPYDGPVDPGIVRDMAR
ncbi:hydroxymethylglutaryl-CoA lyase, partial [Pseudomonadota bacterium]